MNDVDIHNTAMQRDLYVHNNRFKGQGPETCGYNVQNRGVGKRWRGPEARVLTRFGSASNLAGSNSIDTAAQERCSV